MTSPWVDQHRPSSFEEVVGNTKTVGILAGVAEKNVAPPNLLICGPPGCGKTVCVDLLCERFISEKRVARLLRSSSFEDRGIDYVRSTVKTFAKGRVKTDDDTVLEKLVVLDEADSITPGAFQALRRVMEVFSDTTRFIIICNNSTKIIEPIQSRCAILRFSKVDDAGISSRMTRICDATGVEYDLGGIDALACVADGDVRTAINSLGSTVSGFLRVTAENVFRTCDSPQPATIQEIFELLKNKDNFVQACRKLRGLFDDGYCAPDTVSTFFKSLSSFSIEEPARLEVAKAIGLTQARILNGTATYLQLAAMLWEIAKVINN